MPITGISHVAYRRASAAKTVEFYSGVLGLPYRYAIAENRVPSTGEHFPHINIFIEVSPGTHPGFFELADSQHMQFDPNTPRWVQHLALSVETTQEVHAFRERLSAAGVDVVGAYAEVWLKQAV